MPLYPPASSTGYTPGGTDVAVTDGGTGASTASAAATNLGLGTGDSPQFTAVNVGAATDTTVTRTGAGDIAVEGNVLYRAGGTDVAVVDGGTGSSTASNARTALGLAIGTDVDAFASTIGQAEAEAGTATTVRNFTAQRVAQAIAALASGTGAVATDAIWDAAGDLAQGTGANTAAKLSAGTAGHVLTSNGAAAAVSWQAPTGGGGITRSTLGTTSAGASFITTRGTYVKKITLASDGLLSSIHAFVKGDGSSATAMAPVVYTDSSGPVNLLVAPWPISDAGTLLDNMILNTTVRDMSFAVGRWLAAGDYWIGFDDANSTATLSLAYNSGTGGDYTVASAAVPKDSSVAAFSSTAHDWCIYADILR